MLRLEPSLPGLFWNPFAQSHDAIVFGGISGKPGVEVGMNGVSVPMLAVLFSRAGLELCHGPVWATGAVQSLTLGLLPWSAGFA